MRLLPFRIGVGNQGAAFAQPEAPLPKQALALTHAPADLEAPRKPGAQSLPIPQRAGPAELAWGGAAEHPIHLLPLRLAQTSGTPPAFPFDQPGQASCCKASNPILHRSGRVPQQSASLRTGHALGNQQDSMEPVIIARLFRAPNLVLQSQNDSCCISNLQWFPAFMKPQFFTMPKYL